MAATEESVTDNKNGSSSHQGKRQLAPIQYSIFMSFHKTLTTNYSSFFVPLQLLHMISSAVSSESTFKNQLVLLHILFALICKTIHLQESSFQYFIHKFLSVLVKDCCFKMKSGLVQLAIVFLTFYYALASSISSLPELPTSTISAAPALLPNPPVSTSSPALSPDETPLFPSPGGSELSPSDSILPTIPSSLSPPNPDAAAFGPDSALSPFGSLPASYGTRVHVSGSVCSTLALAVFAFGLIKIWSL